MTCRFRVPSCRLSTPDLSGTPSSTGIGHVAPINPDRGLLSPAGALVIADDLLLLKTRATFPVSSSGWSVSCPPRTAHRCWGTLASAPSRKASQPSSPARPSYGVPRRRLVTVYQLIPSEELRRARAEFPHYEICVLHDDAGIPEVTAVLKPPYQGIGLAVLVCAASVSELVHTLRTAPKAKLPRRDPNRRYWPRPWELRPRPQ